MAYLDFVIPGKINLICTYIRVNCSPYRKILLELYTLTIARRRKSIVNLTEVNKAISSGSKLLCSTCNY